MFMIAIRAGERQVHCLLFMGANKKIHKIVKSTNLKTLLTKCVHEELDKKCINVHVVDAQNMRH